MQNQNTQTNSNQFFDLHTRGIGYLNRIREVSVRKGQPFMAVTVGALRGDADSPEYTYFDCRVSGTDAETLVRRCQPASDAGKKVLVGFTIGDVYTDTFIYAAGPKKGETGVSLKGRLLRISFIKINGKTVWKATRPNNESDSVDTADATSNDVSGARPMADDPAA